MRTVAALYVQKNGAYFGLDGVEPWTEEEDARDYQGPHPVVAHPPCNRWSKPLAKVNETRYGHRIGGDGGCFAQALWAVRTFGGVLEHPAHSWAWDYYGLTKPRRQPCWVQCHQTPMEPACGHPPFVTECSQGAYGHRARKRTWLYCVVPYRPALDWSVPEPTAVTSWLQKTTTQLPRLSKREASATPPAFRDLLLDMARTARREVA